MKSATIVDCEFLTAEGSPSRFWCGPFDPDPVIAQIGAVRISLSDDYSILDKRRIYVTPKDRFGDPYHLDPFFTSLTGITDDCIARHGIPLSLALEELDKFSHGTKLWSWGKDEFNMVAISCYVENVPALIPATRFGNACHLFLRAGMPRDDLKKTRSHQLSGYYGIDHPPLQGHDALNDALSVAYALQHLLRNKSLDAADFLRSPSTNASASDR